MTVVHNFKKPIRRYYAGIGSRETPEEVCERMTLLARILEKKRYILRSGGADGADLAFEKGVDKEEYKEIFLPWKNFNGNKSFLLATKDSFEMASKIVTYWNNLSDGAKALKARNCHQILGIDLNTPVDFVVCWTKDGKDSGGTGMACRLARLYRIPVFNMHNPEEIEELKKRFL